MEKKIEWTEEETLKLITNYKEYELLWNPKHTSCHNKLKKNIAWEELAKEFDCQVRWTWQHYLYMNKILRKNTSLTKYSSLEKLFLS